MIKKLLLVVCFFVSVAGFAQSVNPLKAFCLDMKTSSLEDSTTLRSITCDTTTIQIEYKLGQAVRTDNKIQYTFHGLLEDGYDVSFYCHNDGNSNNITFTNGTETDESPFTMEMPGASPFLVAVYGHYDYSSPVGSLSTYYSEKKNEGYIVVLDGSRNKIKRVVKFGIGGYEEEVIETVANIAEFKSKAKASKLDLGTNEVAKVYTITGPLTFINFNLGQSWSYLQDETGSLAVYINHSYPLGSADYKTGDVITGATGYSVGNPEAGVYMDLEAERFYVRTESHEGEFTQFPNPSGETKAILPPKEISDLSAITPADEYTYVRLANCTFEKEVDIEEDSTNVHPHRIVDALGNRILLSLDLFYVYDDQTQKEWNTFDENVANGYVGDFTGFLNNLNKNLLLLDWGVSTAIESLAAQKGKKTSTLRIENGRIVFDNDGHTYSVTGQMIR